MHELAVGTIFADSPQAHNGRRFGVQPREKISAWRKNTGTTQSKEYLMPQISTNGE
jgi:hypothetical protein